MVYGIVDYTTGKFRKWTRVASNVVIMSPDRISIADHVWIWHHSILDGTEGIVIEEGAQIGAWVGVFTHGSESAVRLLGNRFIHVPNEKRLGYTRGSVRIGAYSFIAAGTVILPGVTIGKGCIIGAGALVASDIPDYSIAVGSPAKVKSSTIDLDARLMKKLGVPESYYDDLALHEIKARISDSQ